jgi:hypothetical protein
MNEILAGVVLGAVLAVAAAVVEHYRGRAHDAEQRLARREEDVRELAEVVRAARSVVARIPGQRVKGQGGRVALEALNRALNRVGGRYS